MPVSASKLFLKLPSLPKEKNLPGVLTNRYDQPGAFVSLHRMKKIFTSILVVFSIAVSHAQTQSATICLEPLFHSQQLVPGKMYFDAKTKDSIRIDLLSFYISGVTFLYHDSVVVRMNDFFHLVNMEDTASLRFRCNFEKPVVYDKVRFNIGIDSVTNVSGAFGGDLDPTKGMYWTWQSGYINFKLEGYSPLCNTRNHKFQYHIGGYQSPDASMQTVELDCSPGSSRLLITLDIAAFLDGIDLAKENEVMSPGEKAVGLSKLLPGIFRMGK